MEKLAYISLISQEDRRVFIQYVCVVGVHVEEDAEYDSQIQVKDRCSLRNDKTLPFRQHLLT